MTPFKQLYNHDPKNGLYGDCYRTAIGCLLDLPPEKVPHFYDGYDQNDDATEANKTVKYWLLQQGVALVQIAYEASLADVLTAQSINNPGLYYMLSGRSGKNDCNHVVIACGGDIVWDPSKVNSGVKGPNQNGQIIIEYLVPSGMVQTAEEIELLSLARQYHVVG